MRKHITVLSLDGGGIRGLIGARLLVELERRSGKRISELFDLIAGTSTGGILALGMVKPDDLCRNFGTHRRLCGRGARGATAGGCFDRHGAVG